MKKELCYMALISILLFTLMYWGFLSDDLPRLDFAKGKQTTFQIEKDTLQLGEVRYRDKKEAHFRIKNTGSAPLIIRDVHPSCGCTGVKWEKRPVKPGDTGDINITFDPNSLGRFIKTVEVYCNTEEEVINLKLCGNVIE